MFKKNMIASSAVSLSRRRLGSNIAEAAPARWAAVEVLVKDPCPPLKSFSNFSHRLERANRTAINTASTCVFRSASSGGYRAPSSAVTECVAAELSAWDGGVAPPSVKTFHLPRDRGALPLRVTVFRPRWHRRGLLPGAGVHSPHRGSGRGSRRRCRGVQCHARAEPRRVQPVGGSRSRQKSTSRAAAPRKKRLDYSIWGMTPSGAREDNGGQLKSRAIFRFATGIFRTQGDGGPME